jgi:hypothetical protein
LKPTKAPRWIVVAGVAFVLFLLAITLQRESGAYKSEFGGHPDEAAHFITGLMVRDYMLHGLSQNPMRYAEDYYAHYPKVALGHYPPGFYALEGVWLSVFPVSRSSTLMFMATLCAGFGLLTFITARKFMHPGIALGIAALTIVLPLTQTMTSTIMSDLGLSICSLFAALAFVRFLETGRWQSSLAFGLWATAATMMKGSGLFLALIPPLAILLTRRFDLIKRPSLWVAVVPVAVICGPWMLYSSKITAEGMIDRSTLEHLGIALPYFGTQFLKVFGLAILIPAALGAGRAFKKSTPPFWAVIVSMPIALVVFYSLIPAGMEPRYLLPIIPSILLLATAGILWLQPKRAAIAGAIVIASFFALGGFYIPQKSFSGFAVAAEDLVDGESEELLISSDARGEGAFIAEVALRDTNRPSHTVKRASKVLSTSDWLGRGYEEKFSSDSELEKFLSNSNFDGIVVDQAMPTKLRSKHHDQIARVMASKTSVSSTAERPRQKEGQILRYEEPFDETK